MEIEDRIKYIKELEKEYLNHKYIRRNENSIESKRTFSQWHSEASVFFSEFFTETNTDYRVFKNADESGNAYILSDVYDTIHTSYEILLNKVKNKNVICDEANQKERTNVLVFISHSSKDKDIVKSFVDIILMNGLGLRNEDIAFTSSESTGVTPGHSIPDFVKTNIKGSKVCLSIVSKNYKTSEVCMNEVGAAWAVGNEPIQVVLPDTDFKELGWLINTNKAAKIDDGEALDSLAEEICKRIGIDMPTPKHWNPYKTSFLNSTKRK